MKQKKSNIRLIKSILMILLFISFSDGCNLDKSKKQNISTFNISNTALDRSINKAINFLYSAQLDYGEFKTYACTDLEMKNGYFDSSPFITATVLYSIKDINTKKTSMIKIKALDFLVSEQEKGGIWRYWTSRNNNKIKPDLDDITLISYVLKINNIRFDNNIELIKKNRDKNGLFLTWISENDQKNDVDCTVNADVLVYMGGNYPEVCEYLNRVVECDEECSIYYPDRYFLYYYIARACENGVDCFNNCKPIIISKITKDHNLTIASKSNLHYALALNTLIMLGHIGKEVDDLVRLIMSEQSKNGSWKREMACLGPAPYYGSEELSTAISLEALYRYREMQKTKK